jgi:conjugal transfer pilus assembly protein TraV
MRILSSNRKSPQVSAAVIAALLIAGCGNISGLGGSEHYGCKAPAGVQCQSVAGNYYNLVRATSRLPSNGGEPQKLQPARMTAVGLTASKSPAADLVEESLGYAPTPLRSPPRILRLWVKAWEDADHDLIDQSYVYVRIDQGEWKLDHVQRKAREAYAPLRPPEKEAAATSSTTPAPGGSEAGIQGIAGQAPGIESSKTVSSIGTR